MISLVAMRSGNRSAMSRTGTPMPSHKCATLWMGPVVGPHGEGNVDDVDDAFDEEVLESLYPS